MSEKKEEKHQEEKQTEHQKDELAEMKEMLQRVQANFENYRKQQEKRIEDIHEMANKDLILELLPVLDHLGLALKNTENKENFVKGVELIYSQLLTLLKDKGVREIKIKGNHFDPYYHEALMKVESDQPEGAVVEEIQKGFMIQDKVIRPAKVKVSAGKEQTKEAAQD
ncbi:MAG: nucleotide exchange factor GrpE, partial [Candidatus Woesearchaeota archaeon]